MSDCLLSAVIKAIGLLVNAPKRNKFRTSWIIRLWRRLWSEARSADVPGYSVFLWLMMLIVVCWRPSQCRCQRLTWSQLTKNNDSDSGLKGGRETSYPGRMSSPARSKRGSEESMRCDGRDGRTWDRDELVVWQYIREQVECKRT